MRLFCCALCLDRCEKCVFTLTVLSPRQVFAFDHCFWSMDEANVPKYAGESKKGFTAQRQRKLNPALLIFVQQ